MATYVVGDIQGCLRPLEQLLADIHFDPNQDRLWATGDLVNRGPDNLGVLRLFQSLQDSATVVLGNHDLHLLAVSIGKRKLGRKDTLLDVLQAPDRDSLIRWLRRQPLIHCEGSWVLSHAGIPHIWSVEEATSYATEVHEALIGWQFADFMATMYGNEPPVWSSSLKGMDRLRVITNYLTRMRFVDAAGELDLESKEGTEQAPLGKSPWFTYPRKPADAERRFLFGHWAALEGKTQRDGFYALDTGCIWGRHLTMMRLEDGQLFHSQSFAPS